MNVPELKKAVDFIDREIGERCAVIGRLLKSEKEKRALEARRKQVRYRLETMFSYGGEKINVKDPVRPQMQRVEAELAECREKTADLEGDFEAYLQTADFLKQWAGYILNPNDTRVLFSEEDPHKLCKKLMQWDDPHADRALLAKALFLKASLRGCSPQIVRRASEVLQEYGRRVKKEGKKGDAAYQEAIACLCLRDILYRIREGDDFEEKDRRRMGEALQGVSEKTGVYPVLGWYQSILRTGFLGREELQLLGCFYELYPRQQPGETWYLGMWLTCFKKALQNRAYNDLMKKFLIDGFPAFFACYRMNERKSLQEAFSACLNAGGGQARERFEEYRPLFDETVGKTLEDSAYLNLAADTIEKLWQEGKLPSVKKLDMNYDWDGRDALQELTARCVAKVKADPMNQILYPAFWSLAWIEEKARAMYLVQSAPARKERWGRIAMIGLLAPLGVWMGMSGYYYFWGICGLCWIVVVLPLLRPRFGLIRKDQALLVCYALCALTALIVEKSTLKETFLEILTQKDWNTFFRNRLLGMEMERNRYFQNDAVLFGIFGQKIPVSTAVLGKIIWPTFYVVPVILYLQAFFESRRRRKTGAGGKR